MSISQAQVMDTLRDFFFLFISFELHITLWGLACFVFYYPHPASVFSFPPVIGPVAGTSFFGALEHTSPLFILSPQYHKWNFTLGVEVALLVIWIINTSNAILRSWFFFSQEGRKIKSEFARIRLRSTSLLTYSEQRLGNLNPSEYGMKFQAAYRARMETECAAGDGWHRSQYLRISGLVCAHTHAAHGRWEEWLAIGTDLYFPSLLSILWDQLCHGNTGGGLLQCVTAGVGLCVHCRFIVLLDQDLYSHTPLLSKSLLGAQTFLYLQDWILHNGPWVSGRTLRISARAGSTFNQIRF